MKQSNKPIRVFGAAVANDEIEALAQLAAQVRKKQASYKAYVAIFGIAGALMFFFGLLCIINHVGAVSYVIFLCGVFVLYLVLYGALATTRAAFRRMAGTLNDTKYTPVFGQDEIQLRTDDEEELAVPWKEMDAWTRCSHGLWIITERDRRRQLAVYVNGDQTDSVLFNDVLKQLAENGVKEME